MIAEVVGKLLKLSLRTTCLLFQERYLKDQLWLFLESKVSDLIFKLGFTEAVQCFWKDALQSVFMQVKEESVWKTCWSASKNFLGCFCEHMHVYKCSANLSSDNWGKQPPKILLFWRRRHPSQVLLYSSNIYICCF